MGSKNSPAGGYEPVERDEFHQRADNKQLGTVVTDLFRRSHDVLGVVIKRDGEGEYNRIDDRQIELLSNYILEPRKTYDTSIENNPAGYENNGVAPDGVLETVLAELTAAEPLPVEIIIQRDPNEGKEWFNIYVKYSCQSDGPQTRENATDVTGAANSPQKTK